MSSATAELLVHLIRNACVNDGTPDGGQEARSVATLQEFFGEKGAVFEPHPGRQSVVYRVPGAADGAPTLMLMGHLDVVPAAPADWEVDPFAGERRDGFVWGRGAVDMLNLTAAMAVAFRPYLTGELPPLPGDLVYLGVADEEHGGFLGIQPLLADHPDVVACDYLLTEIAYPPTPTPAGPAFPVTTGEKGPYWRNLAARGVAGHGSQPYGRENAVVDLSHALSRLAAADTPVVITDEWRSMVENIDLPADVAAKLLDSETVDEAIEDLASEDVGLARWAHAATHLTVSPNVVHGGVKANVVADEGRAEVDIRTLPGQDAGTVEDHLAKVIGADLYDRLHIEPVMDHPATSSSPAGPLWEAIGDGLEQVAGTRRRYPNLTSATTDARFFRTRGVVAYGVAAFDDSISLGEFQAMFHAQNERISENSLDRTTELLAATVQRFGFHSTAS